MKYDTSNQMLRICSQNMVVYKDGFNQRDHSSPLATNQSFHAAASSYTIPNIVFNTKVTLSLLKLSSSTVPTFRSSC